MGARLLVSGILLVAFVGRADAGDDVSCGTTPACADACDAGDAAACDEVRRRLLAACDAADARACGVLGDFYWEGYAQTKVSLPTGTKLHRKACELGHGASCNQWAFALAYAHGVARDDARAVMVWKRGCELDNGLSCATYGSRLWNGRSVERDAAAAGAILAKACWLREGTGCSELGSWHAERGDEAEARRAWQVACALGDAAGCDALARRGEAPVATPPDPRAVHAEHVARCKGGTLMMCSQVAADYRAGRGVVADVARADAIEVRTCKRGFAPSCSIVAELRFEAGDLVAADRYFTRACDLGLSEACGDAGMVRRTRGRGHDRRSAAAMFELGCTAKDPASCYGLATAYEGGVGVAPDAVKALAAYERACDGGHALSCAAAAWLTAGGQAATFKSRACKAGHAASCAPPAAP